jgi:hypothetical protein
MNGATDYSGADLRALLGGMASVVDYQRLADDGPSIAAHVQPWGRFGDTVAALAESFSAALAPLRESWTGAAADAFKDVALEVLTFANAVSSGAKALGAWSFHDITGALATRLGEVRNSLMQPVPVSLTIGRVNVNAKIDLWNQGAKITNDQVYSWWVEVANPLPSPQWMQATRTREYSDITVMPLVAEWQRKHVAQHLNNVAVFYKAIVPYIPDVQVTPTKLNYKPPKGGSSTPGGSYASLGGAGLGSPDIGSPDFAGLGGGAPGAGISGDAPSLGGAGGPLGSVSPGGLGSDVPSLASTLGSRPDGVTLPAGLSNTGLSTLPHTQLAGVSGGPDLGLGGPGGLGGLGTPGLGSGLGLGPGAGLGGAGLQATGPGGVSSSVGPAQGVGTSPAGSALGAGGAAKGAGMGGGMYPPFMPMGGAPGGSDGTTSKSILVEEDFWNIDVDCPPPVIGAVRA